MEDVRREFEVKDLIIAKHQEYEAVLLKEIVFAKNIIKNPKALFKQNEPYLDKANELLREWLQHLGVYPYKVFNPS